MLSEAEVLYLQGQKQVSKSYEYKLKSIIKRKVSTLLEKELPLLSQLFPQLDLTKFSKIQNLNKASNGLTKFSQVRNSDNRSPDLTKNSQDVSPTLPLNQCHNKELDILPQKDIKNHSKPSKSTSAENNEQLYIKSREKINNCNTRAGGLAWLRYRLDMAGVVGSNPTRPI